jgi:hypothetical protein
VAEDKNTDNTTDERMIAALSFTNGDNEKARQMIAGQYRDIRVIKGKFALNEINLYGNFMLFVHIESGAFLNISVIVYTDGKKHDAVDISIIWKDYFRVCEKIAKSTELSDSTDFLAHLTTSLDGYNLINEIINNDIENLSSGMTDIIIKFYGVGKADTRIESDDTTSLDLAQERIPVKRIDYTKDEQEQPPEDTRPEIEKSAKFVVEAKAIISPIKGRRVSDLRNGDKILLVLANRDAITIKIAEALGALDDKRQFLPMKGRIVEKVPVDKIGFFIYCSIAKNALAKITEEGNVLIETADQPRVTVNDTERKQVDRNLILYIVLLVGLVAIAFILILALV